ncbi:MFS transporter [Synergistales bacterium]|nr:MFS transporter [Synergistales bacterium]
MNDNKKVLLGLNVSVFMMMIGVGMVMPLLPDRVIAFTGSEVAVGYITMAFAVSYILLQVPMGMLADRLGFKTFIIIGYLCCALSGVLYYFADSAAWIFIGRVAQGMGEAPLWALAPALLSLKFPASKGRVMGIYNATLHVGLTCGPLIGIIAARLSLNDMVFLFFSAVCIFSALLVYVSVDSEGKNISAQNAIDFKNIAALVSEPRILATLAGITLYGVGYGIFITTIPVYFSGFRGYEQTFVQVFFACFYIAISVSQVITGPLSDRLGREKFMICGILTAAVTMAAFPLLGMYGALSFLTVCSLGLGSFYLASLAFLNSAAPDELKGTIAGTYFLFWGAGYMFGPVCVGKLNEAVCMNAGFFTFAALLAIEVLALSRITRTKP